MTRVGESWDGYSKATPLPSEDRKQVDKSLQRLWPPGTFDAAGNRGHSAQPRNTPVYDGPSKPGAKRPKPRKVAQSGEPAKPRPPKSTPGAQQYRKRAK